MTVSRTRVVRADELSIGDANLAPAYRAGDGSFALVNDYAHGTALLVEGTVPTAGRPAFEVWEQNGRAGLHPLGPAQTIDGYGMFTFPYGPVTMGVPEAGRFDLRTYGERILDLVPIGGFKSRRIATAVVGLGVADAALRVERTAGPVAAAHCAAFLAAAESALGKPVPREELWVRALAQELSRIYNHVHTIARIAEAASQNVGLAQAHALAEELLRLQGRHFGHRWLFGAFLPGGPRRRLAPADRIALVRSLRSLADDFDELASLFLESRTFVDRIQTTGALPRDRAVAWGAVGPSLRACGVDWDDRLRIPQPPYTDLFVALPRATEGDALARVLVRAEEVRASFLLLDQLLDRWPAAPGGTELPLPPVASGRGVGRVESPSGDLVYDVALTDDRVVSVGRRSASDANFPVFAAGLAEAVFTDFHFAFESFGLLFSETDG